MDFDEIVVKDSPGLCRCCLSEGCYKDLSTDYTWMGENEIYADMLFECFDISITQHTEGPNGSSRLICEVCITRLRDACNFKKQVLESEKKFVDMVGRGDFKPKVIVLDTTPLKTEPLPGPSEDDCEIEYLDEDADYTDGYRDDEPLQKLQAAGITVSSLSVKGKRGKKRSAESTKPVKAEKKKKAESKASKLKSSKDVKKLAKSVYKPLPELRDHFKIVLERTTAVPFRWCTSRFKCIYCPAFFSQFSKLEWHLKLEHENLDLEAILKIAITNRIPICLNMREAVCKICGNTVSNLKDFIHHINHKHNCDYKNNYKDIFVPVNMKNPNNCLVCKFKGKDFNDHYRHYRNKHESMKKLLCDICGMNFWRRESLDHHIRGVHDKTGFKCRKCDRKFELYHHWNYHHTSVHKDRSYKCCQCDKSFCNNDKKKLHERVAHRINCFKCDECGKEFTVKDKLSSHLKRHFNVKDIFCPLCGMQFYEKKQLNCHLMSHSPENLWNCTFCARTCPTKRSLLLHIRTHNVN